MEEETEEEKEKRSRSRRGAARSVFAAAAARRAEVFGCGASRGAFETVMFALLSRERIVGGNARERGRAGDDSDAFGRNDVEFPPTLQESSVIIFEEEEEKTLFALSLFYRLLHRQASLSLSLSLRAPNHPYCSLSWTRHREL